MVAVGLARDGCPRRRGRRRPPARRARRSAVGRRLESPSLRPRPRSAPSAPASSVGERRGRRARRSSGSTRSGYDIRRPATRRAYLLAPVSAAGATFEVRDATGRSRSRGPSPTASARGMEHGVRVRLPARPRLGGRPPGTYTIVVERAGLGHVAGLPDRHRREPVRAAPLERARVLPGPARRTRRHLDRARSAAGAPQRQGGVRLRTAGLRRGRRPRPRPHAGRRSGRRLRRLGRRRRLREVRPDDELRRRRDAGRHPRPARRSSAPGSKADFTAEARFGVDWLLRMWDDRTRTLYYQVGIGDGNDDILGDHDSWRLPQVDDTIGGTDPAYRYVRHRPVLRAGPPGSTDQPEPRRPAGGRVRRVLAGLPGDRPGVRRSLPDSRRSTSTRWRTRRPTRC